MFPAEGNGHVHGPRSHHAPTVARLVYSQDQRGPRRGVPALLVNVALWLHSEQKPRRSYELDGPVGVGPARPSGEPLPLRLTCREGTRLQGVGSRVQGSNWPLQHPVGGCRALCHDVALFPPAVVSGAPWWTVMLLALSSSASRRRPSCRVPRNQRCLSAHLRLHESPLTAPSFLRARGK